MKERRKNIFAIPDQGVVTRDKVIIRRIIDKYNLLTFAIGEKDGMITLKKSQPKSEEQIPIEFDTWNQKFVNNQLALYLKSITEDGIGFFQLGRTHKFDSPVPDDGIYAYALLIPATRTTRFRLLHRDDKIEQMLKSTARLN